MKRIVYSLLLMVLFTGVSAGPSSAASQTKILKPVNATLGVGYIYQDGSTSAGPIVGGGGTDLNNALAEDGQFALLDPQLPGPGEAGVSSILILDYEKNTICSGAVIQDVKVHAIWKSSELSTVNNDMAVLVKADNSSSNSIFRVGVNNTSGEVTYISQFFGGIVSAVGFPGGTYSGNTPTELTHSTSSTQLPLTLNDLNDSDTRIAVSMGDAGLGDFINISGMVDHAYLEVTYDDASCVPDGVDPATLAAPKTGALLTATIILTALLAGIGSVIFGTRRTNLKHRTSERS